MGFHEHYESEDAHWCVDHHRWEPHDAHCIHEKASHILLEEINHPLSTIEHLLENSIRHTIGRSENIFSTHILHHN